MRPPGVVSSWDELVEKNDIDVMANILEYNAIREHEESEQKHAELKALMSIIAGKQL